jgi:hypothetical protein
MHPLPEERRIPITHRVPRMWANVPWRLPNRVSVWLHPWPNLFGVIILHPRLLLHG